MAPPAGHELRPEDGYIPPGTRVRRDGIFLEDDMSEVRHSEWGIVVACWWEPSIAAYDCDVAFDANTFDAPPPDRPYRLRYAAETLTIVGEEDGPNDQDSER